jgi:hypothetical protein
MTRSLRRLVLAPYSALLVFAAAVPACAHAPCPAEVPMPTRQRLDAALVERIRRAPESEVGVFVRTSRPPDEHERSALAEAGLRVGTVAGRILTGRLRACDAVRVAGLEFVEYVELAGEVTRPPPPPVP